MEATIKLFRAVLVHSNKTAPPVSDIARRAMEHGFVFAPEVYGNLNWSELRAILPIAIQEVGLSGQQANSSFHKSWAKVRDASLEQLVAEQLLHYFSTYGMEAFGLYTPDIVYVPNEALDVPGLELDNALAFTVIKGYTPAELREKLMALLKSGIALKADTLKAALEVVDMVGLGPADVEQVKNREAKVALYDRFDLVPAEPVEFLRYVVYKSTGKTLLIKDAETIKSLKEQGGLQASSLLKKYEELYGLAQLASIFHRFKPLFLALKGGMDVNNRINRIRKLAKQHHKPLPEDFLNNVTAYIKREDKIDLNRLVDELWKVNIFRKARLAQALNFRLHHNDDAILYKIRNGKGFATHFYFADSFATEQALEVVLESMALPLSEKVGRKKVYIPDNLTYAMPATEKQFTGNFPSGTCIRVPKDLIFGVYWEDVDGHRIDLDLALLGVSGKFGWDGYYRDGRTILFSGDQTAAPNGASELFYVKQQKKSAYLVTLNYFNYSPVVPVPFKILTAIHPLDHLPPFYMVDPNHLLAVTPSVIDQKQRILGLVEVDSDGSRFYFSEFNAGLSVTSTNSRWSEQAREYLLDYHGSLISLNQVLELAGARFTDREDCDIDLSPEKLEKDTFVRLLDGV